MVDLSPRLPEHDDLLEPTSPTTGTSSQSEEPSSLVPIHRGSDPARLTCPRQSFAPVRASWCGFAATECRYEYAK